MSGTHSEFARRVGAWIARKRKARGWTQRELAQRVGVAHGTIASLECGRHRIYLDQFLDLADVFDGRGRK